MGRYELKNKLEVAKARVRSRDRGLEAVRDEAAKLKRSAKAEKVRTVLAARKATSLRYRERILKYRAQKEKTDEAVLVLKKL